MRRAIWTLLLLTSTTSAFALGKGKAVYAGGTIATIEDDVVGAVDYKNEEKLVFLPKQGATLEIPWASIDDLEYGQKAGRRVVTAIVVSPVALFAKHRKHYITFAWKDGDDKDQAAVFQIDKNDIRSVLAILKARTGKDITFQDDEAKKWIGGGGGEKK